MKYYHLLLGCIIYCSSSLSAQVPNKIPKHAPASIEIKMVPKGKHEALCNAYYLRLQGKTFRGRKLFYWADKDTQNISLKKFSIEVIGPGVLSEKGLLSFNRQAIHDTNAVIELRILSLKNPACGDTLRLNLPYLIGVDGSKLSAIPQAAGQMISLSSLLLKYSNGKSFPYSMVPEVDKKSIRLESTQGETYSSLKMPEFTDTLILHFTALVSLENNHQYKDTLMFRYDFSKPIRIDANGYDGQQGMGQFAPQQRANCQLQGRDGNHGNPGGRGGKGLRVDVYLQDCLVEGKPMAMARVRRDGVLIGPYYFDPKKAGIFIESNGGRGGNGVNGTRGGDGYCSADRKTAGSGGNGGNGGNGGHGGDGGEIHVHVLKGQEYLKSTVSISNKGGMGGVGGEGGKKGQSAYVENPSGLDALFSLLGLSSGCNGTDGDTGMPGVAGPPIQYHIITEVSEWIGLIR
ncbi:MAG: hypothetical protein MUF42_09855 [Cytophagaceae bacterium]|jgi:hypothetical protein|nr:hypothetical protein [Cytophagaceae bacterium]